MPEKPLLTPAQANEKIAGLEDEVYVQRREYMQLMPTMRYGGVGIRSGRRVPSLAVWVLKGRDYWVGRARDVVEGKRTLC